MAKPELGSKQQCPKCTAKFYDLNRRPAACPKCAHTFDPEEALKIRRGRSPLPPEDDEVAPVAAVEPEGYEDEVDDTPEIDQAIEADAVPADDTDSDAGVPGTPDDLGVDFAEEEDLAEDAEGVPFLVDDDDDDFPDDEIDGLPGEDED